MKKLLLSLLALALAVSMGIVGIGCPDADPDNDVVEEPTILQLATGSALVSPHVQQMVWFAEEVEDRTDGMLIIEVYPAGELYASAELAEATITGAIDMSFGQMGSAWPEYNPIFTLPSIYFLWPSREENVAKLPEYREILDPALEELGVKPLGYIDFSTSGLVSAFPIESPADFEGLQIRGPIRADWVSLEALGATPVRIALGEVYDALQRGAVDGVRTGFTTVKAWSFYETPAQYLLYGMLHEFFAIYINADVWNTLPEDFQNIIMDVAREAEQRSYATMDDMEQEIREYLDDKMTLVAPAPEDIPVYRSLLEPVIDEIIAECDAIGWGDEARQLVQIAQS